MPLCPTAVSTSIPVQQEKSDARVAAKLEKCFGARRKTLSHGAVWSIIAPLQLWPKARGAAGGVLHRWGGRVMLTAAAALMVGYSIIDANDLYADTHDFEGHGGSIAAAVDGEATRCHCAQIVACKP